MLRNTRWEEATAATSCLQIGANDSRVQRGGHSWRSPGPGAWGRASRQGASCPGMGGWGLGWLVSREHLQPPDPPGAFLE